LFILHCVALPCLCSFAQLILICALFCIALICYVSILLYLCFVRCDFMSVARIAIINIQIAMTGLKLNLSLHDNNFF
jgi:hypothetical protein